MANTALYLLSVTHDYFVTKSTRLSIILIATYVHIIKNLKSSRTWSISYSGSISCEKFGGHTKHILLLGQTSILSNRTVTSIIYDCYIRGYYKSRSIHFFELDPVNRMA